MHPPPDLTGRPPLARRLGIASASVLLALTFGFAGASSAIDRYAADVWASGTVGYATSIWHFDNDGAWKYQAADGPLLPFQVQFHNNGPAGSSRFRARIVVTAVEGVPGHWGERPTSSGSAYYTAFLPPGESFLADSFNSFSPTLKFLRDLPPGNSTANTGLFHDFRPQGDGPVIPMRERIKFRVSAECDTGAGGGPRTYDSAELVVYSTGQVTLAADSDAAAGFSFIGRIPIVHVYARPDLIIGTRPGAIDGAADDIERACACDEACIAGAVSANNNSVDLRIGLGTEGFETPRSLRLKSDVPGAALARPAGLEVDPATVQTFDEPGTNLLQIEAERAVVAVETLGDQEYELRFYHKADAGAPDPATGLYSPAGPPHTTIHFENPDGVTAFNRLAITRTTAGGTESFDYLHVPETDRWELETAASARKEITQTAPISEDLDGDGSDEECELETRTLQDADGGVISKTSTKFWLAPFGRVKVAEAIDPDGRNLETRYSYYDQPGDGTAYGLLKYSLEASGLWTLYEYDDADRVTKRVRPAGDPAIAASAYDGSQDSQLHVVSTSYNDAPGATEPHQTVSETYLGAEIARRHTRYQPDGQDVYVCQTPSAAMLASDNLVTKFRKYTSGEFSGAPSSISHPDGTLTLYSYTYAQRPGGSVKITTIDNGAPDGAAGAVADGVRTVTETNDTGTVVAFSASDIATGTVTEAFNATTDEFGRPVTTTYLDGTTKTELRDCCSVTSTTDRLGVTTYYNEGDLAITEVRNGIARVTQESPSARPGGGKVITVTRSEAGADNQPSGIGTLVLREEYDAASLLVSSYGPPRNTLADPDPDDLGTRTHLQFDTTRDAASGRLIRSSIAADGGTLVREFYADGRLARESGTSVYAKRFEYGVESPDGQAPAQFFTRAIVLDQAGEDTPEWTKSFIDMLGRDSFSVTSGPAITSLTYHGTGQLASARDPDGVTTLYAYDLRGRLQDTAIDMDQDGSIGFDGGDRITRIVRGFGTREGKPTITTGIQVWTTVGQAAATATIATVETSTDGLDRWATTDGLTTHTSTTYAGEGISVVTTTNPDNSERSQIFDDSRITSDTLLDAGGAEVASTSYSYDTLGRLETITDAHDGPSQYTYYVDDLVRTITTPDPDLDDGGDGPLTARQTGYRYTASGMRDTVTHPDGSQDRFTYHLTGEIHTASGTRRTDTATTFDHAGRIKTFTAAGSGAKTWHYHPASGFLESIHDASGRGASFTYTSAGRLSTRTSAGLPATLSSYRYDRSGALLGKAHSDPTPATSFTYDRMGYLRSATRGTSTHSYTTTPTGRVELETVTGGPLDGLQIRPSFDALLRRDTNQVTLGAAAFTQSFGYDAASRPLVFAAGEGINASPSATYTYYPGTNRIATTTFADPGGNTRQVATRLIDKLRRTTSLATTGTGTTDPLALSFGYRHNQAGQRDRVGLADGGHWSYAYGQDGQLENATRSLPDTTPIPSQTFSFTSDAARNRLTSKRGTSTTAARAYSPDALDQYTTISDSGHEWITGTAAAAAAITVDGAAASRPGEGGYFEFLASADNTSSAVPTSFKVRATSSGDTETTRLRSLVEPAQHSPFYDAEGRLQLDANWTYSWDADDQLVAIETASGVPAEAPRYRVEFDYDHAGRRIAKRAYGQIDGEFILASHTRFIHDGTQIVAEIINGQLARSYLWGLASEGSGGLLAITDHQSGATYFPAFDGNGNLTGLTDAASGESAARYAYSPYGQTIEISGAAAHLNPFRFSTQYHDPETGLYHFGARYYDPADGRWLKRDPAGISGGTNDYAFLGNDPVNQVDVGGLISWRTIDYLGLADDELGSELQMARQAETDLTTTGEAYLDELNSSKVDCGYVREMHADMVDSAVEMGIHLNRASILARDYYTEANPAGADQAYAEKLRLLRGRFADYAQIDYARLGHMRNNLEILGADINQQLNANETTLAISKATLTASFALLDVAGTPALSSLAVAGTKLAGRAALGGAKKLVHGLGSGATKAASVARAATSKVKSAVAKKYGSAQGGYQKLVSSANQRPVSSAGCFVAGTLVATDDGPRTIESLSVGDRVLTADAEDQSSESAVAAESWRHLSLQMVGDDPRAGPSATVKIELLRPARWLEARGCHPGTAIPFAIPEMGLSGTAKILSITPCPPIKPGTGRVVLMTFTRTSHDLVELTLANGEKLTLTQNHRLHSADRDTWIPASHLEIGEHLSTRNATLSVSKITPLPGNHQVFNLEAEQDHRYFTSNSQILSHNACGEPKFTGQGAVGRGADEASRGTLSRNIANFQGMEVRAVRNLSHVDNSTLRAMADKGFAAKTVNGDKIVLHHHQQNSLGPIIEVPAPNHSIGNSVQHPFGNTVGEGLTASERAAFNVWRTDYWKSRAAQEISRRAGN